MITNQVYVTPGYFETPSRFPSSPVGGISDADGPDQEPVVVICNKSFARKFYPGEESAGKASRS